MANSKIYDYLLRCIAAIISFVNLFQFTSSNFKSPMPFDIGLLVVFVLAFVIARYLIKVKAP